MKPPEDLVFITQTGSIVKRKDQQRLVRKHVMKDIGKLRRKPKTNEKPNSLRFDLEIPDSFGHLDIHVIPRMEEVDEITFSTDGVSLPSVYDGSMHDSDESEKLSPPVAYTMQAGSSHGTEVMRQPQSIDGGRHRTALASPRIERLWTGRMDPFIHYPIKMTHRTLQLMDHVFDERYGNTPPFREAWLPVGMLHAASFHQVLSNAALNIAALRARKSIPEQKESMKHHTTALKLIAKDITDREQSIGDGVIGAIIGFACYSHVIGNQSIFHMHMKAVMEVIRLRGGINTFHSNPILRIVVFWVDVSASVTGDTHPYFPLPSELIPKNPSLGELPYPLLARQISNSWRWEYPETFEVINIMGDIRSYSHNLEKEVIRSKSEIYKRGAVAAYGILPLLHRLLNLKTESTDDQHQKMNIVRLGCILYFAEIRRLFGIMGIMHSQHIKNLRSLLEFQADDWGALEILKAWVLTMASMECTGAERKWFYQKLQISRNRLGVNDWQEMERQFKEVLWYGIIHSTIFGEVVSGVDNTIHDHRVLHGSRFGGYRPLKRNP